MNEHEIDRLAKKIWDYLRFEQKPQKSDIIFVLCSNDLRVADYAAQLYKEGWAPLIIFSGFRGKLTEHWDRPEAEIFADRAVELGVPRDKILIENKATNTGENVTFTKQLLQDKGLNPSSFILLQKPFMERRTFATFQKLWPEKNFVVLSFPTSYETYPQGEITKDYLINVLVGDLQRIKLYPEKGYMTPQPIPADVWDAYEQLVQAGFTNHLIS